MLRRLSFAAYSLHKDTPKYWELATRLSFAKCSGCAIPINEVKVLVENVQYLDEDAFNTDSDLQRELMRVEGFQGKSLGIVLISANNKCKLCGGDLLVRADRPSFPIIYSDDIGTANGTHFRKYCQNNWKGCSFTQSYGFHTNGNDSEVIYDNYHQLPYFVSSHMTAFQTSFLPISLLKYYWDKSHTDRTDIYNYIHEYDQTKKQSVAVVPSEFSEKGDYDRYLNIYP